jgi:cobalt-zinc-cadmium efflux system outer membrane protein
VLAKATRAPNVDLSLGYAHNGGVALNHPTDPTPAFNQLVLGVSIPLPLFDRGREGVSKALAAAAQARSQLAVAELRAEVEIRTADARYRSARQRVQSFDGGILKSADELLEAKRFSYQRGAATLLELLDAQRSANDIRADYEQALSDAVRAEIDFERAGGAEVEIHF